MGYSGFDAFTIDSTWVDQNGNFKLTFGKEDFGMGYLIVADGKSFVVILTSISSAFATRMLVALMGRYIVSYSIFPSALQTRTRGSFYRSYSEKGVFIQWWGKCLEVPNIILNFEAKLINS